MLIAGDGRLVVRRYENVSGGRRPDLRGPNGSVNSFSYMARL